MSTPQTDIQETSAAPAKVQEQERIDAQDQSEGSQQNEQEEEQGREWTLASIAISVNDVGLDLDTLQSDIAARIKEMKETLETIKSEIQKFKEG